MLVHVGGLVEADIGTPGTHEGGEGGSIERASTPPTAGNTKREEAITSSSSSASIASTGSLPSAVAVEAATTPRSTSPSDSSSTPPLPPPSESAAQQPPARTATEAARSRTLVPRTEYLPVPSSPTETVRSRSEREAKEAVREWGAGGGIVLDPDREVMLKFLVGKTGDRHGKLPVMVRQADSRFSFLLSFLWGKFLLFFSFLTKQALAGLGRCPIPCQALTVHCVLSPVNTGFSRPDLVHPDFRGQSPRLFLFSGCTTGCRR
jgi:hypothetical protein